MFFNVTATFVIEPMSPATVILDGYGAPGPALEPLPGMVIEVLFEKVAVLEEVVPS
jgi:hypothetical protein